MVKPWCLPWRENREMTGMLVTAVNLVDTTHEHGQLTPMMVQAEETTGTRATTTLGRLRLFCRQQPGRMRPPWSAGGGTRKTGKAS